MTAMWAVLAVWTFVIGVALFAAVHVASRKVAHAEQIIRDARCDCERSES